jgi:hypothetical protein
VFDRFRQAESTASRGYGGLGLGLSIAKQLVEAHKGSIWAESAGAGSGATFTVRLPAAAQRADEFAGPAAARDGGRIAALFSTAGEFAEGDAAAGQRRH